MPDVENTILNAKDKLPNVTPTPPSQQTPQSSAQALKQRLEWGEVAFTILDVRDRGAFNASRIMGAVAMPMGDLPQMALDSLEPRREIYVYGDSDEQSAQAANQLRQAGFESVSELRGGLAAWKAIGGPTEGNAETGYDASSAEYNVKSRLDKHAQVTSKNL
ncbi:rhodanese-like domain-containing protein [Allocoleopsis franciscana]|uniref:Rhodanese-related sulfurtransferase n=1 Tax=Allocoleopsis franciscana PCC 7113 TaxID=1173027 RepID=K9WH42_9CYAN|nr:rhodanese-like domain-containing protein [Allocoleopsis franciscana]AFZ19111.1 Rhodanese-related sulfurtransferase [Allocoleopsis franciscana PCC 7113]